MKGINLLNRDPIAGDIIQINWNNIEQRDTIGIVLSIEDNIIDVYLPDGNIKFNKNLVTIKIIQYEAI